MAMTRSLDAKQYEKARPYYIRGLVIPAQAGIHPRLGLGAVREMDPRLRGDDSLSLT